MAAPMDAHMCLIRDLFEGIKILTSPSNEPTAAANQDGPRNDLLETSLTKSMEALHHALDESSVFKNPTAILGDKQTPLRSMLLQAADKKWAYVEHCLAMLESLRCCLHDAMQAYEDETRRNEGTTKMPLTPNMAPAASPDTLSFSQQMMLSALTQFITSLGICPALLQGVGLPLNIRSKLAASVIPLDKPLPFRERQRRLNLILRAFADCIKQPVLGGFILSKNLNDVLALLIQLGCTVEIQKTIKIRKPDGTLVSPTEVEPALPLSDIQFAKTQLEHLALRCYQPSIIKELLFLQGGMGSGVKGHIPHLPKPPQWMRKVCGRLLAERIMADKGVAHFLQGVIDDGDMSSGSWSRCDAIANLLATPPSSAVPKEVYYESVCHQMLDVLHSADDVMMRHIVRVISSSVVAIVTNERMLAMEYILGPLLKSLIAATNVQGNSQRVLASESELSQCMSDIHRVFIIGREPSSRLLSCLTPILHHLFTLYCFTMEGVCNLRTLVEEILCAYLRTSDHITALTALEHISAINTHPMYGRMDEKVTFTPGPSGGATMLYQGDASLEELFTQNLMRHEHIGRCSTALLLKVSHVNLSADFFISVLNEMTSTVASLDSPGSMAEQDDPPSTCSSSGHSRDLLDFEPSSQAERINTVQHALRVLAILEQLCEALGPEVLKDTRHLLLFCQAALQRCVDRLKREEGDDGADIPGVLETETLTLAVALLSALITREQKNKAEPAERQILQDILPLLMTISKLHSLEPIQKLADDLVISIATHGAVSSSSIHQAGQDVRKTVMRNEQLNAGVGNSSTKGITKTKLSQPKAQSHVESHGVHRSGEEVSNIEKEVSMLSDVIGKALSHGPNTEAELQSTRQSLEKPDRDIPEKSSHHRRHQDEKSFRNEHMRISGNVSNTSEPCRQGVSDVTTDGVKCKSKESTLHHKDNIDLERLESTTTSTSNSESVQEISAKASNDSQNRTSHNDGLVLQLGTCRSNEDSSQQEKPVSEVFEEAMKDLTDPLLPVRGHALIMLARLLKEKDPRALAESENLLKIFEEHLSDEDTYIYLPSVNGLVALAVFHPDRVMPHLCDVFTSGHATDHSTQWSGTSQIMSLEKTLKLGEALVKATRQLGELVPRYRDLLLNTIMAGARHPNCHIRASCLVHLGEVCGLLRYSLGTVVHEVLNCVTSAVKNDPEPEVKRSAVQVMNLLLRGLGNDAIQVLDASIRDVYRCLKHVRAVEKDEVLLLHAQLALEELDVIMRQYLFPKQTLSKKITVLNP